MSETLFSVWTLLLLPIHSFEYILRCRSGMLFEFRNCNGFEISVYQMWSTDKDSFGWTWLSNRLSLICDLNAKAATPWYHKARPKQCLHKRIPAFVCSCSHRSKSQVDFTHIFLLLRPSPAADAWQWRSALLALHLVHIHRSSSMRSLVDCHGPSKTAVSLTACKPRRPPSRWAW